MIGNITVISATFVAGAVSGYLACKHEEKLVNAVLEVGRDIVVNTVTKIILRPAPVVHTDPAVRLKI